MLRLRHRAGLGVSSCDVRAQSISPGAPMASAAKLRLHAKVGDERLALIVTTDLSVGECAPATQPS